MTFNKEKYINLILYILLQCSDRRNFGKTMLCSILYSIDFNHYKQYGDLITNETYIKSKKGIQPKHFRKITKELIMDKKLYLKKQAYYNRTIHKYYPLIIPHTKFTKPEYNTINHTIKQLKNNNAHTITKHLVKNPVINIVEFGDEINIKI